MKAYTISLFLKYHANCPDSLLRNKAKNALSLAMPFSLGLAGAKIDKISYVQRIVEKKLKK